MKLKLHIFLLLFLSFSLHSQITTVGLIGEGSPLGNWDNDVDMVQNDTMPDIWTLTATLLGGPVKFRANDNWDLSWGDKTFPWGIGSTNNGPNLPGIAGTYDITFNSATGEYFFDYKDTNVGIIGAALPIFNWDRDINMFPDPNNPSKFFITLNLEKDGILFRENDNWDLKYGSTKGGNNFPSGNLIKGASGENINVSSAAEYYITLDTAAKTYDFAVTGYKSIGLIGEASPLASWEVDTNMVKDPNIADLWSLNVNLTNGGVKFRADDDWANNWGSSAWPKGTGVASSSDNIPAQAGRYNIEFNSKTLEYNFREIKSYAVVGIIGDATLGGVDTETAMTADPSREGVYTLRSKLKDGFVQFVTDDDRWASGDFPSGTAEIDGGDIPVTAGDYKITFNTITGGYNFEIVVEYDKVALVGRSGPFGDWPDDANQIYREAELSKDPSDVNHWTLASVTLTDHSLASDGGIKFRANTAWTINWGAVDFPEGKGTQNGPNIQCAPGTYKVDFRSDTGDYAFSEPNSTINYLSDAVISVFPNPTASYINIVVKENDLKGKSQITLFDAAGKVAYNGEHNTTDVVRINASTLNNGKYIVRISNDKFFVSKNISVVR